MRRRAIRVSVSIQDPPMSRHIDAEPRRLKQRHLSGFEVGNGGCGGSDQCPEKNQISGKILRLKHESQTCGRTSPHWADPRAGMHILTGCCTGASASSGPRSSVSFFNTPFNGRSSGLESETSMFTSCFLEAADWMTAAGMRQVKSNTRQKSSSDLRRGKGCIFNSSSTVG